jgi:hypothetical protein
MSGLERVLVGDCRPGPIEWRPVGEMPFQIVGPKLGPCCIEADLAALRAVVSSYTGPEVMKRMAECALERLEGEFERRITWRERLKRWWAQSAWNPEA